MQRVGLTYMLVGAFAVSACVTESAEDLDPATTLGGEDWSDDGPTDPSESSDAERVEVEPDKAEPDILAANGMPTFQLPFPCGQVWAGQTRTNHSPRLSVDFNRANDIGDRVVAAASGRVTIVGNTGGSSYGRWIEIAHGSGYRTRYAHLDSQSVAVGQTVQPGQKIGTVGSTGGSTGPHLHYELRHYGGTTRAVFQGRTALYYGTRNYTSQNSCNTSDGAVVGRVNTTGAPLTLRAAASSSSASVGSIADGARAMIVCQKRGTTESGTYGTSNLWDKVGTGYIADAYVSTGSDGQIAPTCW